MRQLRSVEVGRNGENGRFDNDGKAPFFNCGTSHNLLRDSEFEVRNQVKMGIPHSPFRVPHLNVARATFLTGVLLGSVIDPKLPFRQYRLRNEMKNSWGEIYK